VHRNHKPSYGTGQSYGFQIPSGDLGFPIFKRWTMRGILLSFGLVLLGLSISASSTQAYHFYHKHGYARTPVASGGFPVMSGAAYSYGTTVAYTPYSTLSYMPYSVNSAAMGTGCTGSGSFGFSQMGTGCTGGGSFGYNQMALVQPAGPVQDLIRIFYPGLPNIPFPNPQNPIFPRLPDTNNAEILKELKEINAKLTVIEANTKPKADAPVPPPAPKDSNQTIPTPNLGPAGTATGDAAKAGEFQALKILVDGQGNEIRQIQAKQDRISCQLDELKEMIRQLPKNKPETNTKPPKDG
jgi:hypothetical protein